MNIFVNKEHSFCCDFTIKSLYMNLNVMSMLNMEMFVKSQNKVKCVEGFKFPNNLTYTMAVSILLHGFSEECLRADKSL